MPAPADRDFVGATIDNLVLALDKRSEAGVQLVHSEDETAEGPAPVWPGARAR